MNALEWYLVSLGLFFAVAKRRCFRVKISSPATALLAATGCSAVVYMHTGAHFGGMYAVLVAALVVVTCTDLQTGYVFDDVLAGAAAIIIASSLVHSTLGESLEGALAGAAPFGVIYGLTRGHGVGLGDLKLAALIGLSLGCFSTLVSIGYAFIAGALWALGALLFRTRRMATPLAFAPFLSLGVAIVSLIPGASSWLIG